MEETLADVFYFDFYAKIQKAINLFGYLLKQPPTDRDFPQSLTLLENTVKMMIQTWHLHSAQALLRGARAPSAHLLSSLWIFGENF